MLRRDFISKIIEQMVNAVARLLKTDIEEEQEKFLEDFNEFLRIYFQFPDENLAQLLEENEERDAFLLDEKLKNQLLHLFANAGLVYVNANLNQIEKAKTSLKDRKSTRLNSSHVKISYAVFCLKKKNDLSYSDVKSPT